MNDIPDGFHRQRYVPLNLGKVDWKRRQLNFKGKSMNTHITRKCNDLLCQLTQYFTIPHIIHMDSTGFHWIPLDSTGLHWTSLYNWDTNLDSTGLSATINTNLDSTGLHLDWSGLHCYSQHKPGLHWTPLLYSTQTWTPLDSTAVLNTKLDSTGPHWTVSYFEHKTGLHCCT